FFQHLRPLQKKEMTRFCAYAASPYFNKHSELRHLIRYCGQIYPYFEGDNIEKERVYREIFGGHPFDEGKLAPLLTYAQRLLESFLAQEQFGRDPFFRNLFLLKGIREKNLYALYEKRLPEARDMLEDKQESAFDRLFKGCLLDRETLEYRNQTEQHQDEGFFEAKQLRLDHFFVLEKLRDACEVQVRQKMLRTGVELHFLAPVLQAIETDPGRYLCIPALEAYYRIYLLLSRGDLQVYRDAMEALGRGEAYFSHADLILMYNYLMNYCIGRINQGETIFLEEVLALYRIQLDKGLLLEDGILSEWDYKNIVTTGIRLGQLDWTIGFIEAYKDRLNPDSMDNAYRFNLAACCYAMGQYERVLDLLIRVEYSDLRYSLGAKALLLRTYYDLEAYEALFSLADAFRQYLQRNDLLADARRTGYLNLIKFTRKAAQLRGRVAYLKPEKATAEYRKIQEAVEGTTDILNRGWLEEKLEALKAAVTIPARR
ncbi:MAG: hypothetical protein RL386_708, partial [Bacteroidota bacterium]